MASLLCTGCGSQLTLPADPTAVLATCQFCGVKTLLSEDLVHLREESFEEKRELEAEKLERVEHVKEEIAEKEIEAREKKSTTLGLALVLGASMAIFAAVTVVELVKNAHQKPVPHPTHAPHPQPASRGH